jgi:DNA-binding LacI/PurR family transcriptional regulator
MTVASAEAADEPIGGDPARTRPPTMTDVAELAGVSRQLVSMVMRGVPGPSESSRRLVLEAAATLQFRPNASARLLRRERTGLIGMLVNTSNVFQMRVAERFIEEAAGFHYRVVLGPLTPHRDTETVLSELLEQRVEALACFNPDPGSSALDFALGAIPVVWLGERATDPRADVVRTDDDAGVRLVVRHLMELGHRRIAYAGGAARNRAGIDRAQAYRNAMTAEGLGGGVDVLPVGFSELDGATAASALLRRAVLPTAVVCCSDHCAAGVRATFAVAGVDVPGAVSVTGYDDSEVAALPYNSLTSVRQDVDLTVNVAVAAIRRRLDDPASAPVEVPTTATLVPRASTGPARVETGPTTPPAIGEAG